MIAFILFMIHLNLKSLDNGSEEVSSETTKVTIADDYFSYSYPPRNYYYDYNYVPARRVYRSRLGCNIRTINVPVPVVRDYEDYETDADTEEYGSNGKIIGATIGVVPVDNEPEPDKPGDIVLKALMGTNYPESVEEEPDYKTLYEGLEKENLELLETKKKWDKLVEEKPHLLDHGF